MSEQYGGLYETRQEREARVRQLDLSVWDLFDPTKPWVLVPDGSLLGIFDFKLRIGPWSPAAPVHLFVICYTMTLYGIWLSQQELVGETTPQKQSSCWWYYNVCGFLWMMYVSYIVYKGPAGPNAWVTYTMWTWSIVTLRHGLAVLYGLVDIPLLSKLLRWTHFPSLCMATMMTTMWNLVVGPALYFFFMTTPTAKRKFLGYFTSFRLIQLHVFCLFFAVLNHLSTPHMEFHYGDLYVAMMICFVYMLLYLLILDRIGVHIYPIFSPRIHWCVLSWSGIWFLHLAIFWMWNGILRYSSE